jgi:hypothetical protein
MGSEKILNLNGLMTQLEVLSKKKEEIYITATDCTDAARIKPQPNQSTRKLSKSLPGAQKAVKLTETLYIMNLKYGK